MIPYRDENPTRTLPIVTILLIAVNVAVYLYQITLPEPQSTAFIYSYALVPAFLLGKAHAAVGNGLRFEPVQPVWLTILTSMFMHGGFWHIFFNMLYLWIFGNNVEETLGRVRYLGFYVFCGAVAAGSQIVVSGTSATPMLGASGAIAGVLGAYLALFPRAGIRTIIFFFIIPIFTVMPASLLLIFWLLGQILASLSSTNSGIATFAHIGGFVIGWLLLRNYARRRPRRVYWDA